MYNIGLDITISAYFIATTLIIALLTGIKIFS